MISQFQPPLSRVDGTVLSYLFQKDRHIVKNVISVSAPEWRSKKFRMFLNMGKLYRDPQG